MRNIFKTFIILLALGCGASCSLKEDTSVIVNPEDFYQNEAQIKASVRGLYRHMNNIFDLRYFVAVEGATDIASTNGSAQKDAKLEINPSSPGAGTHVWQRCYYGVKEALASLDGIEKSPVEESIKVKYKGEVEIMLAHYYYILTSFYGDVPFYLDFIETDEDINRVAKLGRMPADETRATLIKMLKESMPLMDQVRSCDVPENHAGAAVGWMLIAKMAAWNEDWLEVIDACKHLEAIYGDLNQYPYSDVMFRNKNTPESILEIQHEYVEGGINYITPSSLAISAVCLPYPKTAGTDIYDGVNIPEIGTKATCYTPVRPTSYFKNTICSSAKTDSRASYNMSKGYGDMKFNGSRVWMGPKFWCPGVYQNKDNNNYKVFRYADAVLLLSEAYCELGDFTESVRYLNMVKERAGAQVYTFQTQVRLRGEIRDERARELFGEFGRKYDLVRWGIWYQQVLAYNTYKNIQANIRPCHEYYPIPSLQCEISGGILSNPEYVKYNLVD